MCQLSQSQISSQECVTQMVEKVLSTPISQQQHVSVAAIQAKLVGIINVCIINARIINARIINACIISARIIDAC